MGDADYFAKGSYNVICDQCAKKMKHFEAYHQWDNLVVCRQCYDPRPAQDFVRGVYDRQAVPDPRPDPDPIFSNDD